MFDWDNDNRVNERKVSRAVTQLKKEGNPVTSEGVKALYVSYGGFLPEAGDEQPLVEEEEVKPKRRTSRTS